MKTEYEIYMDYRASRQQADQLCTAADRLLHLSTGDLDSCLAGVRKSWKGAASRKYLSKGTSLSSAVKKNARELKAAASALKNCAENLYYAELQALEIARAREGKE